MNKVLFLKRLLVEHLPISVLIGILGWLSGGGWQCVPFALAVGWCIDADHLFDFAYFWLRNRKNPDWYFILYGGYYDLNGKIFVPLHSWELTFVLVVVLGILTQKLDFGIHDRCGTYGSFDSGYACLSCKDFGL